MSAQIKDIEEYNALAQMMDTAEESLTTLAFGSHYALKMVLKTKYGVDMRGTREDDIAAARRLCDEFMTAWRAE